MSECITITVNGQSYELEAEGGVFDSVCDACRFFVEDVGEDIVSVCIH